MGNNLRPQRPEIGAAAMGIDAGSSYIKVVLMNLAHQILATAIGETGISHRDNSLRVAREASDKAGLRFEDIAHIVSTGYGRRIVNFANQEVTEISCHARGAHWLYPQAQMVIDIGGQDSKVIVMTEEGKVTNFVMNDKCAAGTGRFLEVMARALQVNLDDMGMLTMKAETCAPISSVCTVFAESEVISLLANGHARENIMAGIFEAITRRVMGMVARCGQRDTTVMTGGVARNIGMVKSLEKSLGRPLLVPDEPQMVGALGASIIALDQLTSPKANAQTRTQPSQLGGTNV